MEYAAPIPMTGKSLKKYFKKHVTSTAAEGFYVVHTPLHVFKKVRKPKSWGTAIVNLTLPVGTTVYASWAVWEPDGSQTMRKMRASSAFVHSIFGTYTEKEYSFGRSDYNRHFKYVKGKTVTPFGFSTEDEVCGEGIHFFLNLADAMNYHL